MLQFAPWHAAIGGLTIGTLSAGKTLLTSRILGISGAVKGFLLGDAKPWRVLFLGGLVGGGTIMRTVMPGSFEILPASFSFGRAILAGLMVGAGTALGNGCTSGHGIAGLSRLSVRSLAYTCVFMAAAAASTTLSGTPAALGIPQKSPQYVTPSGDELKVGLGILAAAVVSTVAIGAALAKGSAAKECAAVGGESAADSAAGVSAQRDPVIMRSSSGTTATARENTPRTPRLQTDLSTPAADAPEPVTDNAATHLYELLTGLQFAFALGFGRMTRPSVVSTFLAALQTCWNPTLAFVMGGGLLVATPIMQWLVKPRKTSLSGSPMRLPSSTVIDSKLIVGGLLFGAGWGMGGFCPGPALVALGNPQPKVAALCTAMFVGMWCVTGLPKGLTAGAQDAKTPQRGDIISDSVEKSNVVGANQKEE